MGQCPSQGTSIEIALSPLIPQLLSSVDPSLLRSFPPSSLSLAPSLLRSVLSSLVPFLNPPFLNPPSLNPPSLPPLPLSRPSHHRFLPPLAPSLPPPIRPRSFPACVPPAVQLNVHRTVCVCLPNCTEYCVGPSHAWH